MHVHVDIADEEGGVRVIDGLGPWLPPLLAASANSPYAAGRDTGHASWRSQLWGRWPSHGTGEPFGDVATSDHVRERMQRWRAALDEGMICFDARLALKAPTVEVRVATLIRALVTTVATSEAAAGPAWRSDLLRAATWRAARDGLAGDLVDPVTGDLAPAHQVLAALVDLVRPALEDAGDVALVETHVERLLCRGDGASRQRAVFEREGTLQAVVADALARTDPDR